MASARYLNYLQSAEWRYLAARVRARDNNMCQDCGNNHQLHVHHLTYERIYHEPLTDLITLCDTCHRVRHGLVPAAPPAHRPQLKKPRARHRRLRVVVYVACLLIAYLVLAALISAAGQTS